jgi:glycosyltransferase involved in cell wall biosynthesis
MKILMVHNRYRETGGEDHSTAAETAMLQAAGKSCISYQLDNRDIKAESLSLALNTIWSRRAARDVRNIIRKEGINVVHVQNFFPQISPSVHWAARNAGAAVVQTLRNYRLSCINGLFFRDGRVCEECLGRSPIRGIIHRCYRGSLPASSAVASMLVTHRVLGTWTRCVDRFIAISRFTRDKMIAAGLPADRIVLKPNFLETPPRASGPGGGGYFVYVGRLSPEKGIRTLLESWKILSPASPTLKIVGTGPLESLARSHASTNPRVEVLGSKTRQEVLEIVGRAEALIVPSECYETFGRAAMEAYSVGTPVIGSDIGAVAEMVTDGESGLHFRTGSPNDLAVKIRQLIERPQQLVTMRQVVRRIFEDRYTETVNLHSLLAIYRSAMQSSKSPSTTSRSS